MTPNSAPVFHSDFWTAGGLNLPDQDLPDTDEPQTFGHNPESKPKDPSLKASKPHCNPFFLNSYLQASKPGSLHSAKVAKFPLMIFELDQVPLETHWSLVPTYPVDGPHIMIFSNTLSRKGDVLLPGFAGVWPAFLPAAR